MKKALATILVLVFSLLLLTSCGSPLGGKSSKPSVSSGGAKTALKDEEEDPCDCCINCDRDDCEFNCDKCECCTRSGDDIGSFTFQVEIYAYVAGWRPIHKTYGIATVTVDEKSESGYFGIGKGDGEYTEELIPETGQVEKTFDFTMQIKDYDPLSNKSIVVGINRIGADAVTNYAKSDPKDTVTLPDMGNVILRILGSEYFDEDTGIYFFEVQMEADGSGYRLVNLDRAAPDFEGHIELSIHVKKIG